MDFALKTSSVGGLDYHPLPQWKESISSYVIRIASPNGYSHIETFLQQMFESKKKINRAFYRPLQMDFMPPAGLGNLLVFTGYNYEQFTRTTFYNLVAARFDHFDYKTAYRWLNSYLRKGFAYCPLCVKEYSYYALTWRFRGNPGCSEHALKLVEVCHVCGTLLPLPLLSNNAMIGQCPFCEADLTKAPLTALDGPNYEDALEFDNRLSQLLSSSKDRQFHLEPETTRSRSAKVSAKVFPIHWDKLTPEFQEFANFKTGYEKLWTVNTILPRLNKLVKHLFTLYWMGSHANAAMQLYIRFRNNPDALDYEMNRKFPRLLENDYFCGKRSSINQYLPSEFEILPMEFRVKKLEDAIREMQLSLSRLQTQLFYYPDEVDNISAELLDQLSNWISEVDQILILKKSLSSQDQSNHDESH